MSIVTVGELQLGVLSADDPVTRAVRAATMALARTADPLPVGEAIMVTWARLVPDCQAAGSHRMVKLTDSLIAATAIEHGLPIVTQDTDHDQMAQAHPALRVEKV